MKLLHLTDNLIVDLFQ